MRLRSITLASCLALFTAQAGAADQAIVRGRVEAIDVAKRAFTIHTSGGEDVTVTADARSQFMLAGKAATFDQVQRGQKVRATFERRGAINTLTRLRTPVTTDADVLRESREALRAAGKYAHEQKDRYADDLRQVLEDVDDRIDDLKDRAIAAKDAARRDLERRAEMLEKKRDALHDRLEKVESAGENAWDEFKAGVTRAADELWRAFEDERPDGK